MKSSQIWSPTRKSSQVRQHKNLVQFNPHTKNQVIWPTTWIKSFPSLLLTLSQLWCRDKESKLISIHTLKPSHCRPPHKSQVSSDPYTEIKASSILHIEIKSISTNDTKMISISMLTQKPSDFWPEYENK